MDPAHVGAIGAVLGLGATYALFARFLPPKIPRTAYSYEVLKERYGKADLISNVLFVPAAIVLGYVFWLVLTSFASSYAHMLPPAEITITALSIYWAIPAMFLGMTCAMILVFSFVKVSLPGKFDEFLIYKSLKSGFDYGAVLRGITRVTFIASAALVYCGLHWYVLVKNNTLIVSGFSPFHEDVHPLKSIARIRFNPEFRDERGETVDHSQYTILFDDGTSWKTNYLPEDLHGAKQRALIDALAKGSGRQIE